MKRLRMAVDAALPQALENVIGQENVPAVVVTITALTKVNGWKCQVHFTVKDATEKRFDDTLLVVTHWSLRAMYQDEFKNVPAVLRNTITLAIRLYREAALKRLIQNLEKE